MELTILEESIILNELYIKKINKIEKNKVDSVIKNSLNKNKEKLSKKFNFIKSLNELSKDEKIKFQRRLPENYAFTDTDTGRTLNYKRQIKTIQGNTLVLYFDSSGDLHFMYILLRNKKNDKLVIKRLFWRLHSNKKTVKEDSEIF
jgi:hypothetical protein